MHAYEEREGLGGFALKALKGVYRRGSVVLTPGLLGVGVEGSVWKEGSDAARKVYSREYFRFNEQYDRHLESDILTQVKGPHIVTMLDHDEKSILIERLGKRLGGGILKIIRIEDNRALDEFLDVIPHELAKNGVLHHDIHPGNILYDPRSQKYKLIDFAWARFEWEEGYVIVPKFHYPQCDGDAIDAIREDVRSFRTRKTVTFMKRSKQL